MERRRPTPDVTPQQLRDRSWWTGPRFFVLLDDYDLIATSTNNPLAVLTDKLPYARDTGIHLIVTRTTAGISRALYEPVLQRLTELGAQASSSPATPTKATSSPTSAPAPCHPAAPTTSPANAAHPSSSSAATRPIAPGA